jgi:hypothetical protein
MQVQEFMQPVVQIHPSEAPILLLEEVAVEATAEDLKMGTMVDPVEEVLINPVQLIQDTAEQELPDKDLAVVIPVAEVEVKFLAEAVEVQVVPDQMDHLVGVVALRIGHIIREMEETAFKTQ